MSSDKDMDYGRALQHKLAIGLGTAVGSMVAVALIVFLLLVLYRNHKDKSDESDMEETGDDSRRVSERSIQSRPPLESSTSDSSSSEPIHSKDIRISLDNFSYGSASVIQTDELAVRLENELEEDRRQTRRPMDIYDTETPSNVLLNCSYEDSAFGSSPNHIDLVSSNHSRDFRRTRYHRDFGNPHVGRSISHEPYVHPTERFNTSVSLNQNRSHSFDADRHLLDQIIQQKPNSNYVPKTLPSRTRNIDRERYFGDDVPNHDGIINRPPHRRSDLESELTGYFDSPLDKRYRNYTVNEEGHDNSEFLRRNPELWTQHFDYTQFSRLPRIPLSFSGNRRFFTEHPQRGPIRPI